MKSMIDYHLECVKACCSPSIITWIFCPRCTTALHTLTNGWNLSVIGADINVNLDGGTHRNWLKRPHVAIAVRWEIESSDQLVVGRLVVREILRGLCGKLPTVCNLSGNCTFLCPSPPSHLSDYPTTWILLHYAYSPGHPSAWLPWSLINLATWNPIALVTLHVPVEPTESARLGS